MSYELAVSLLEQRKFTQSIVNFMKHLTEEPRHVKSWVGIGIAYYNLNNIFEALQNLEVALEIEPNDPSALISAAVCYSQVGMHEKASNLANLAAELAPHHSETWANRAYICSANTTDRKKIKRLHEDWGQRFADPITIKCNKLLKKRKEKKKINVGFVSGDLRQHSILYFMVPIFEYYDKNSFNFSIFQTLPEDKQSDSIKHLVDNWFNVENLNNDHLYELIQSKKIDILIDLSGHTLGNRLLVFAMRPAPLQITWFGYLNTLGMKAIDYRITDWSMDPPGSEEFYTEKLLRLDCMACYAPPIKIELPDFLPSDKNGYTTLISMNHWRKLNDELLDCWQKILSLNPNTKLIIIGQSESEDPESASLIKRFEKYPLLYKNLILKPRMKIEDFMRLSFTADFALDTYPISGGTTTYHSLWMGLPIVTRDSVNPASASTASTLKGLGLTSCVAKDVDQYVSIATRLIKDKDELKKLRSSTRTLLLKSALMQYDERVREFQEKISTKFYEQSCTSS
jgi:predicted O-linked N-acetylglucosamine transferase (SPINDLY family)